MPHESPPPRWPPGPLARRILVISGINPHAGVRSPVPPKLHFTENICSGCTLLCNVLVQTFSGTCENTVQNTRLTSFGTPKKSIGSTPSRHTSDNHLIACLLGVTLTWALPRWHISSGALRVLGNQRELWYSAPPAQAEEALSGLLRCLLP